MISENQIDELSKKATEIRLRMLRMFSYGKAHHFGGSFSSSDIVTALYLYKMNYSLDNYQAPGRDRFIMSKGHCVPAQYALLSMIGIIPENDLRTIKTLGSTLQGHPDINKTRGIEAPTGSLGQGLSYANGISLAGKLDDLDFNIYVMIGDGELQEGQVWEAIMTTAHYGLNNTCVIVDRNKYQSQGSIDELMGIEALEEKFSSFGWESLRVDGHDMRDICEVLDKMDGKREKPLAIIADTIKGKGISFLEDTYQSHNCSITEKDFQKAEKELLEKLAAERV